MNNRPQYPWHTCSTATHGPGNRETPSTSCNTTINAADTHSLANQIATAAQNSRQSHHFSPLHDLACLTTEAQGYWEEKHCSLCIRVRLETGYWNIWRQRQGKKSTRQGWCRRQGVLRWVGVQRRSAAVLFMDEEIVCSLDWGSDHDHEVYRAEWVLSYQSTLLGWRSWEEIVLIVMTNQVECMP